MTWKDFIWGMQYLCLIFNGHFIQVESENPMWIWNLIFYSKRKYKYTLIAEVFGE